eukprot:TRINITY_DN6376_c1_g1_i1.p1 TRINITY_DN6376_c1_g1~~TRINITY_DN6376_c1_g1_i1.p1  ORF type:complete len:607 (+),score=107.00 TRINITY_DN6376_c1_g1_i1:61-1821(+)
MASQPDVEFQRAALEQDQRAFLEHLELIRVNYESLHAEASRLREALCISRAATPRGNENTSAVGSSCTVGPSLEGASSLDTCENVPIVPIVELAGSGLPAIPDLLVTPEKGPAFPDQLASPEKGLTELEMKPGSAQLPPPAGIDTNAGHLAARLEKRLFRSSDDIKSVLREQLIKQSMAYDATLLYKTTGIAQKIARHQYFEYVTFFAIGSYAIWLGYETDNNPAELLKDAPMLFFAIEQIYCTYFFLELVIRFAAFRRTRDCLCDPWFMFDFSLVMAMVLETWVMTVVLSIHSSGSSSTSLLGNAAMLRIGRLMRLIRLLRMARLLRQLPELLILIKAIAAAMRSVTFTLGLLGISLYVFGIVFTQTLTSKSDTSTGSLLSAKFANVASSMQTLYLHATLLDDIGNLVDLFEAENQYVLLAVLHLFLVMSAITIVNMLIGVICEVIKTVAASENESIQVMWVTENLQRILTEGRYLNSDGKLEEVALLELLQNSQAVAVLKEIGVDVVALVDFADFIFSPDILHSTSTEPNAGTGISFSDFMELVLQLRGSNTATVKDVLDLRKWFSLTLKASLSRVVEVADKAR